MGKAWYASKTLWVNALGIAVIVAQSNFSYVISPETQIYILGGINMLLRLVTKEPVEWS